MISVAPIGCLALLLGDDPLGFVVLAERLRPDARTLLANGERALQQGSRTRSRVWIPAEFLRFEFLDRDGATRRRAAWILRTHPEE